MTKLTRDSPWKLVSTIPIKFTTHHPQGMVKIGETFFYRRRRVRPGAGRSVGDTCSRSTRPATSLADLRLGEGTIYHPGGIDYDGAEHLGARWPSTGPTADRSSTGWIPATMKATEVFRFADHIGAIVHNTDDHTLHGVSWGSRRFYRWTLGADRRVTNAGVPPEQLRTLNPSHYVDYQDCKYVGGRRMLCTGVTEMRQSPERAAVPAGRDRSGRPGRRPAAAPGAAAAVDAGRVRHDAQPGVDRGHRRRACAATSCRKTIGRPSTSTRST